MGSNTMTKKNNVISLPDIITNITMMKLNSKVSELEQKQRDTCEMAVRSILKALNCKDEYTHGHSTRVAYYSLCLARELDLSDELLYDIEVAALFHDIGKIGVPDDILRKPDRLNAEEFEIMKKHPELSEEILKGFEPFENIARYTRHHHERYDGRGYPDGLKGEEIPFASRVILIADTFDAMTSTRPYRKGLSYQIAFEELREFSGTQFDPKLVEPFIQAMEKEQAKQEEEFNLTVMQGQYKKDAA